MKALVNMVQKVMNIKSELRRNNVIGNVTSTELGCLVEIVCTGLDESNCIA